MKRDASMAADDPADRRDHFFQRDLSWIAFNRRILAQAEDPNLPVLDRLKFLAIVASNLDEFIVVRVALARRRHRARLGRGTSAREADPGPDGDGIDAAELDGSAASDFYDLLGAEVRRLFDRMHQVLQEEVRPALLARGIALVEPPDYTPEDMAFLRHMFLEQILPAITPLTVDPLHPWPLLTDGTLCLYFHVRPRAAAGAGESGVFFGQTDTVICQLPSEKSARFLRLPSAAGQSRFAVLEDVIAFHADKLLVGYDILGAYPFRIHRDAELSVDQERSDNFLAAMVKELRRVRSGDAVRVMISHDMPDDILDRVAAFLGLTIDEVCRSPGLLNLKTLFQVVEAAGRPGLVEPPWPPVEHPAFRGRADLFAVIRDRDVLVVHPYHAFDPVVRFIEQAATDPDVLAIKITLYRVGGDSPIVKALIHAAQEGKQVTALVELRARFDEEANIIWARRLDEAGAHVIYGVRGHKTHSKAALVVRREPDGIRRYCHLATGNYNNRTARQYTDLGYFTSRPDFGADLSAFFNVVTGYSLPPVWQAIEMAPTGLRRRLLDLIDREMEKHAPESPGHIRAKMNSLTDPSLIRALYRASAAGVRADLIVRGMCCLRPGVKGLSETITVRSIIDRFLEHPRIFHFRNGGHEEVYLASADWMERNMDKRIELMFPVHDPECRREALAMLAAGFADNANAWELGSEGRYRRLAPAPGEAPYRSQQRIYAAAAGKPRGRASQRQEMMFEPQRRPSPPPAPGRKKTNG